MNSRILNKIYPTLYFTRAHVPYFLHVSYTYIHIIFVWKQYFTKVLQNHVTSALQAGQPNFAALSQT